LKKERRHRAGMAKELLRTLSQAVEECLDLPLDNGQWIQASEGRSAHCTFPRSRGIAGFYAFSVSMYRMAEMAAAAPSPAACTI